jgi:hypothetical protein
LFFNFHAQHVLRIQEKMRSGTFFFGVASLLSCYFYVNHFFSHFKHLASFLLIRLSTSEQQPPVSMPNEEKELI